MATIFQVAAQHQAMFNSVVNEANGYKAFTTFFSDFTIADLCGGAKAVKDTYNRAYKEWKDDVKYMTELSLVLNHKCWYYYETGDQDLSILYSDLWTKCHNYCLRHFKGDDFQYYYKWTD